MKKYLYIILYSFLLTILSARVDDATCYNYAIIENSFYLYADGYIGGIQMTLTHGDNFELTLAGDSFLDGYNTDDNQTTIIIVVPGGSLLFSTSDQYEIAEIIVAANMDGEVAHCPDSELGEIDQVDLNIDEIIPNTKNALLMYPNPFNPITTIEYHIESAANIQLHIFDIYGQKVRDIYQGYKPAGMHKITWEPDLSSGQYYVKLMSNDEIIKTSKVTLLK